MVIKNIELSNKSKKLFLFFNPSNALWMLISKSSNRQKNLIFFMYLTGFKKMVNATCKEQNIIKEIFFLPNEFGNNESP